MAKSKSNKMRVDMGDRRTAAGRRKASWSTVESPYASVHDESTKRLDPVVRITDPLKTMTLDDRQLRAAGFYRDCYEAQFSALGGSMDFERVRSPGYVMMSPADHALSGSHQMARANEALLAIPDIGKDAAALVERVAGRAYTLRECARAVYGRAGADRERKVSAALKVAFSVLADLWFGAVGAGVADRRRRHAFMAPDARPTTTAPGPLRRGKVAHYGGKRLCYSGGD